MNWCFTINNPTDTDDLSLNFDSWSTKPTFAIYNLEVGKDGTPHYQGYLELPRSKPLNWMKNRLPRAHLEKRKGSQEQAILYCLKDCQTNGDIWLNPGIESSTDSVVHAQQNFTSPFPVLFNCPMNWVSLKNACEEKMKTKMKRTQALMKMKDMIEQGSSDSDLANFHFPTWVSCNRSLTAYRLLINKPRDFKPNVFVCQGPTGTGKSKWAMETFPNAYWKQRSNWWDGYQAHESVVIDEFYGWLPFDLCLRLCDRYPVMVETKGGNVHFVAKNIIFTSNSLPSSWWKNCYFPSFTRRVDEWHMFPVWGMHVFYQKYEEALPHFFNNQ